MTEINIKEIEVLFKLVIEKLKNDRFTSVEFNNDEYWIITTDEWDRFEGFPKPAVGSIKDDLEFLRATIKENVIYSYSDFDRLATILRAISEIQAPSS